MMWKKRKNVNRMMLIDADALEKDGWYICRTVQVDKNMMEYQTKKPTAFKVLEVVRCKDCKFWQNQEDGVVEVPICARPENKYEKLPFRFMIGKDGFCSFAERRTDV